MRKLLESIDVINEAMSLKAFKPPFRANGLWVSDKFGNSVLECVAHGIAEDIAKALNSYMPITPKPNKNDSEEIRNLISIGR